MDEGREEERERLAWPARSAAAPPPPPPQSQSPTPSPVNGALTAQAEYRRPLPPCPLAPHSCILGGSGRVLRGLDVRV